MYCLSCGSDLKKGEKKCHFCGHKVLTENLDAQTNDLQEETTSVDFENEEDRMLNEEEFSILEGSENKVESDLKLKLKEIKEDKEPPKIENKKYNYSNVAPVRPVLPKTSKKRINIEKIIYKITVNTGILKKIIIGIMGVLILVVVFLVLLDHFFQPVEWENYSKIEKENIRLFFNDIAKAQLIDNNRLDEIKAINGRNNIAINNISLDEELLGKIGFLSFDNKERIERNLNVVWERFFKRDKNLNNFSLRFGNIDLFRMKLLKEKDDLNIYMPDINSSILLVDTSNVERVYENLGLTQNKADSKILRSKEKIKSMVLEENKFLIADNIKQILDTKLDSNDVQIQRGVSHTLRVGTSKEMSQNTDRYEVRLNPTALKMIINEVLESVSRDDNMYKIFVERYAKFLDVFKFMGIGEDEIEYIGRKEILRYVLDLQKQLQRYNNDSSAIMNVWINSDNLIVGRALDFLLKNDDGNKVNFSFRYSSDAKENGYRSIIFTLDSNDDNIQDIDFLIEMIEDRDELNRGIDERSTTARYTIGNKKEQGYMLLDFFSSYRMGAQNRKNSELMLKFEKEKFLVDINAQGIEAAIDRDEISSKDYNVEFSIISEDEYSGKFDMKIDTIYDKDISFPSNSYIVENSGNALRLDSIDEESLNKAVIDFQLGYNSYMRRISELLRVEFFLFGRDV